MWVKEGLEDGKVYNLRWVGILKGWEGGGDTFKAHLHTFCEGRCRRCRKFFYSIRWGLSREKQSGRLIINSVFTLTSRHGQRIAAPLSFSLLQKGR